MVRKDTISSTEKLLDVIRDKKGTNNANSIPSSFTPVKDAKISFIDSFLLRKTINVGVIIGYSDIKLVKICQFPGNKRELVDYHSVPFEQGLTKDSPQFPKFLKSVLNEFVGSSPKIEIWSAISSAKVEMRYLRIPKVAKKEIANAVFWTYKKEVAFKESEVIFDFEVLGDIADNGVQKIEVTAYTVPKNEVKELKDLFSKIGFQLSGISIVPFAIQNFMRTHWIENKGTNLCMIYVGRGWSRIDIFSGENLILSRGIRAGINSMIEAIKENFNDQSSALQASALKSKENIQFEETIVEDNNKNKSSISLDQASKIFYSLLDDSVSLRKGELGYGLKDEQIFDLIRPALDRLVGQVERTLKHYSLKFKDESVAKIYISGPMSTYKPIVEHFGEQLLTESDSFRDAVEPFAAALLSHLGEATGRIESYSRKVEQMGDTLSLESFDNFDSLAKELPFLGESKKVASVKESFVPAVGMALSNYDMTPNFLFNYKDKENVIKIKRANRFLFAGFVTAMIGCVIFNFWQGYLIKDKRSELSKLSNQLDQFNPKVDRNQLVQLITQIQNKKKTLVEFGKKYQGMAVLNELADLTPENIKLQSINTKIGEIPVSEGEKGQDSANIAQNNDQNQSKYIILEGIISGDRLTLETSLTGFLVKLETSPLFGKVIEKEGKLQPDIKDITKEVLYFTAKVEII